MNAKHVVGVSMVFEGGILLNCDGLFGKVAVILLAIGMAPSTYTTYSAAWKIWPR